MSNNLPPIAEGDDAVKSLRDFKVDNEISKLSAKIETLRNENVWLRSEIERLQYQSFDRDDEIARLHEERMERDYEA